MIYAKAEGVKCPVDDTAWLQEGSVLAFSPDYPEEGSLEFPIAVIREYGVNAAHTLAALWNNPKIRRGSTTDRYDRICRFGCIAERTFKRHLAELAKIVASFSILVGHPTGRTKLGFSAELRTLYGKHAIERLFIPKWWFTSYPDYTLAERVLWAYYRYRCQSHKRGNTSHCVESFAEITATLGGDIQTWRKAAAKLAKLGKINRVRMRQNNYSVSMPEQEQAFPLSTDHRRKIACEVIEFYEECFQRSYGHPPKMRNEMGQLSKTALNAAYSLFQHFQSDVERTKAYLSQVVVTWPEIALERRWLESVPTFRRVADPDFLTIADPVVKLALGDSGVVVKLAPIYKELKNYY